MQHPKYEAWPYNKVLPAHVQPLIDRYQGGESTETIAKDFPFGKDVVLKVLRDFDIPIKTRKENRFSMGHTINENAFSDTNEVECAYFYGWILTDGNLRETKYGHSVSLELSLRDVKIVESLKEYIASGNMVRVRHRFDKRTGNTYSMCSFAFAYSPLIENLLKLGLEPRKSMREIAPKEFLYNRDFWRGVLEGDGYIAKPENDLKIVLCGSETLCNQWKDYCQNLVPDMPVNIKHIKNGLYNAYSGRSAQCKIVLDSLYLGVPEHLRLERKYNLYMGRYYKDGIIPNGPSIIIDR